MLSFSVADSNTFTFQVPSHAPVAGEGPQPKMAKTSWKGETGNEAHDKCWWYQYEHRRYLHLLTFNCALFSSSSFLSRSILRNSCLSAACLRFCVGSWVELQHRTMTRPTTIHSDISVHACCTTGSTTEISCWRARAASTLACNACRKRAV